MVKVLMRAPILSVLILAISTQTALAQSAQCSTEKQIVFILNDDPGSVISAVSTPNTTVLLAPDVDITFSNLTVPNPSVDTPFINFARCVTLASFQPPPQINSPAPAGDVVPPPVPVPGSGRTPHSLGPVLRYSLDEKRGDTAAFIQMACDSESDGDGGRVLGIRIFGPHFEDHHTSEKGINILGCHDVEITNMEVAGWSVPIRFGSTVSVLAPGRAPRPLL